MCCVWPHRCTRKAAGSLIQLAINSVSTCLKEWKTWRRCRHKTCTFTKRELVLISPAEDFFRDIICCRLLLYVYKQGRSTNRHVEWIEFLRIIPCDWTEIKWYHLYFQWQQLLSNTTKLGHPKYTDILFGYNQFPVNPLPLKREKKEILTYNF